VQEELVRRRVIKTSANGKKRSYSCNHCFAQIVICGECGEMFRRIHWNNRGYKRFKKAYSDRSAYDKALEEHQKDPEHHPDPPVAKGEFGTKYSAEFLKNLKDNYRRNRDLCIIITAGLYVLQIIDAHVDAHLKSYDISDDLSVEFTPAVNYVYSPTVGGHRPTFGFNFNLNF